MHVLFGSASSSKTHLRSQSPAGRVRQMLNNAGQNLQKGDRAKARTTQTFDKNGPLARAQKQVHTKFDPELPRKSTLREQDTNATQDCKSQGRKACNKLISAFCSSDILEPVLSVCKQRNLPPNQRSLSALDCANRAVASRITGSRTEC